MKFLKIIGKLFAVIFSMGYFFGLIVLLLIIFVGDLTSGEYYAKVLKKIDLKEIKISDLGDNFVGSNIDPNSSVNDVIVNYLAKGGVKEEVAIAIIENDEIKNVAGKIIGDIVNKSLGSETTTVTKDDLKDVFNNKDVIEVLESELTDEEIDKLYSKLENLLKEGEADRHENTKRNNHINSIN